MIPTTPKGTRTWRSCSPLARVEPRTTSPTGSGSPATSRSPWAIPSTREASSRSRSTMCAGVPPDSAACTSAALAARIACGLRPRASAIASSAAVLDVPGGQGQLGGRRTGSQSDGTERTGRGGVGHGVSVSSRTHASAGGPVGGSGALRRQRTGCRGRSSRGPRGRRPPSAGRLADSRCSFHTRIAREATSSMVSPSSQNWISAESAVEDTESRNWCCSLSRCIAARTISGSTGSPARVNVTCQ